MQNDDLWSTMRLALKLAWTAKVRILLSSALVALAIAVFLVVTELARIASSGLEDAIDAESGVRGSYAIESQTTFGLGRDQFVNMLLASVRPLTVAETTYVVGYPAVSAECPPYDVLGAGMVRFIFRENGSPYPLVYGGQLPEETKVCLAGAEVPPSAIFVQTRADANRWGDGLTLSPLYEQSASLMTSEPIAYRFVVTTGKADSIPGIREALSSGLGAAATRFGQVPDETTIAISRMDQGERVRAASDGVRVIFGVLGWGVLLLGGLGLLVSQLIIVRGRMWFFGLSAALGARRQHIAMLVLAEVAVTVGLGVLAAVAIALLAQPVTNGIAQATFDTSAELVSFEVLPRLVTGSLLLLLVASAWPAVQAGSQDPLDVLEPKFD